MDLSGLHARYVWPGELDALAYLLSGARTVVEFGCNNGRTAAAMLRNVSTIERYVGVDVPVGYKFACNVQRNETPQIAGELALSDKRFELVLRARGSFDLTADDLPTCDAVFIDGDHSEPGVLNDYALAKAIVRRGGIIVFHDDNGLSTVDVSHVLDGLCKNGADIKHVAGTWLAFERV